ncbi:MAG: metalloregulator ArsR/SmtB family transcription factor [Tissierellia bacterium]|nr:metalloregulator ArsR/SmtB family transcription factor [Tissierellia bacterium]
MKVDLPHKHDKIDKKLLDELNDINRYDELSEIFKLLSDKTRLRLFLLLCQGEYCVVNISYIMNMSSPAISHHLRSLKYKGLINSRREGKEVYYKASDNKLVKQLHKMVKEVMRV